MGNNIRLLWNGILSTASRTFVVYHFSEEMYSYLNLPNPSTTGRTRRQGNFKRSMINWLITTDNLGPFMIVWLVGCVLRHINHCWISKVKYYLPPPIYIYIYIYIYVGEVLHTSAAFTVEGLLLYKLGMIFYINHFSLIIFYHSVWLGFELFGLRAQMQSELMRKEYANQHCHNKPLDRKCDWSVEDVMQGRDGPENLRILKKESVEIGSWRQRAEIRPLRRELGIRPLGLEFWPLKDVVGFFGSLPTEIINITRYAVRWDGVSIAYKNCVSLLVSPWTEVKKLIDRLYLKWQSLPVFAYVLEFVNVFVSVSLLWWDHYIIYNTITW